MDLLTLQQQLRSLLFVRPLDINKIESASIALCDAVINESEKINDLERIIQYAADDLGVSVSYLKKVALEWAKDDPLTDPDFEDRNT